MKNLLLLCLLLPAIARSQTTSVFCVQTNCPITITAPTDSCVIFGAAAIFGTKDTITSYLWKQVSGPGTAVLATPTSTQTVVRKLVPGTYVFSLTATSKGGSTQTVAGDNVTVLPAPLPPRTVKSVTFQLVNGVWIPSFVFSDGSTQ